MKAYVFIEYVRAL